ncbi:MAG: AAA family ATPase, partial [Desulfovibrionaceae bacterium]|nr:AAA family ATPase [Desulfovibrionaceae bacterium]
MAKAKDSYSCSECGAIYTQWKGQCPSCNAWNTLQLITQTSSSYTSSHTQVVARPLSHIVSEQTQRISTTIPSLDTIFGSGIVPGSSLLLGGEPGIGKSTFVLQIASLFARQNHRIVYASGEESVSQISLRAQRLDIHDETIFLLSTSSIQDIFAYIATTETKPSLLIVDSVQTLTTNTIDGFAGNVNQVKAVASECIDFCKQYN